MKKILIMVSALAVVGLSGLAKDFLIKMKSGEEIKYSLEDIQEVTFDSNEEVTLPEDLYPSALDFNRKVLLMDHTGVTCGNCPLMTMGLRTISEDPEYAQSYTLLMLHSYGNDPMGSNFVREISSKYSNGDVNGYPYVTPNFKTFGVGVYENVNKNADQLRSLIDSEMMDVTPSGIASIATLNGNDINLTLSVKAGEDGRYRAGAFLVEDGLQATQTNLHPDLTGDLDFDTHHNVLRTMVGMDDDGGYTGVDLGVIRKGQTGYTQEVITMNQGWKKENCRLVIYVTEEIDGKYVCVNSAYAPIDGQSVYEYDSAVPGTDAYITMSKSLIEVSSAAGSFSVPFTLSNGAKVSEISVASNESWIKNLAVKDNAVTFDVEENTNDAARKGTIQIAYGDARAIEISVRQNRDSSLDNGLFLIETTITGPYSVKVDITPQGYKGNYLFLVAKKSVIDGYLDAGNIEAWIEGDIEWLQEMADAYGWTLSKFLDTYKQAYQTAGQPVTMTYSDLSVNTEYYAYCYGLTTEGEVTTDFYKKEFKTEMVSLVDLTLDAKITNIGATTANIEVMPSNNIDSYFWTYITEMDWAQYDLYDIMDNMIENIKTEVQLGTDINNILHVGKSGENATGLWTGTKYYLVGWGMDSHCTPTTPPMHFGDFTTQDETVSSACTFEVDCPNVKDNDIQIHIKPTDNDVRYYVGCVDESKCVGYNPKQMAQRIINMEQNRLDQGYYGEGVTWENADWMLRGEQTKWAKADLYWTFNPSHTYNIYVFGVDAKGELLTEVAYVQQTTLPASQSDMIINIELTNPQWDYGYFTFTPSVDDEYYIALLVETEEMKYVTNADGTLNEMELCMQIEHYYDDQPEYYVNRGKRTLPFRWVPERDYTMLVCGWSGGNTTHFFRLDVTSPAIPFNESNADVECTYELFDGVDLAQFDYDKWKDYVDNVVIRLTLVPNEYAAYYTGGVWPPAANYSDLGGEAYIVSLLTEEYFNAVNRPHDQRALNYGETYSLSSYAKDKDGKFGPWHYMEFTPTPGQTDKVYDWWSAPTRGAIEEVYAISPEGKVTRLDVTSFGEVKKASEQTDTLQSFGKF